MHYFEYDFINNMDHMRILITESSSVISQTRKFKKLKVIFQKCQKQAEAKRDDVMKP